ncbi:hypothetical protein B0H12DRAFT_131883 [Mycena haematopus]|nr:hypothetical protein B0H12DRAFT_131883 [Mycena haematopus]
MPTTTALEQLKTALEIVAALGDGAMNIPVLRAVASTAIKIIEIAQTVTKNKEDAIEVAKDAAERATSLLHAFKGKSKDDIPLDLQQDIAQYAKKLELVHKVLAKHRAQNRLQRVLSRASNREDIIRCRDILNESFQVLETSLTLKLHTRLPELLSQFESQIIAHLKLAPPNLSTIRSELLDLRGYLRSILRAPAPSLVTLRAEAAAFIPRRSSLRADAPDFLPRKLTLRAIAPIFVPRKCPAVRAGSDSGSPKFTLRADAPVFAPRKLITSLRADAPVFVPAGRNRDEDATVLRERN